MDAGWIVAIVAITVIIIGGYLFVWWVLKATFRG